MALSSMTRMPARPTTSTMRQALTEHIASCVAHPLAQALAERDALRERAETAENNYALNFNAHRAAEAGMRATIADQDAELRLLRCLYEAADAQHWALAHIHATRDAAASVRTTPMKESA